MELELAGVLQRSQLEALVSHETIAPNWKQRSIQDLRSGVNIYTSYMRFDVASMDVHRGDSLNHTNIQT